MNRFRVWVRQFEGYCRVCVAGIENARWLLRELDGSFVFPRGDGIIQGNRASLCVFHVLHGWPLTPTHFVRRLAAIPAVDVTGEPDFPRE